MMMDGMPHEVFQNIIALLPIREVFLAMRVSKRWEAGSRAAIRGHKRLVIKRFGLRSPVNVDPDLLFEPVAKSEACNMWKSIHQMAHLEVMIAPCVRMKEAAASVAAFNANSMRILHFEAIERLCCIVRSWPQLEQLVCGRLQNYMNLPKLQSLTCSEINSLAALSSLPSHLKHLNAVFDIEADGSVDAENKVVMAVLSKFTQMQDLRITISFIQFPESFFRICPNMESFRLHLMIPPGIDCSLLPASNDLMPMAGHWNMLKKLDLAQIILTDEFFQSLAQLHYLTHVTIFNNFAGRFTTAGVLSLLRGSSRTVLKEITIKTGFLCCRDLNQEKNLIKEETARVVKMTLLRLDDDRDSSFGP